MARRVFIAGATGQIGRPLTAALVSAGDEVFGLARSEASAAKIRAMGATPLMGDALNKYEVLAAVREARPDVIVHQLTAIPTDEANPRKFGAMFEQTNRLRWEGTRHLVDAAEANGVQRVLAQSIAFVYPVDGPAIADESVPIDTSAPGAWGTVASAVDALETAVLGGPFAGVVMRYGMFHGPGSAYDSDGTMALLARKRRLPIVGGGTGRQPFIHMDDAVRATLLLMDRGEGVYNVVDDDPAPGSEWIPGFTAALGAPAPRRVPAWLAKLAAGSDAVRAMTRQRGASNARLRELGWEPKYPDWRAGFKELGASR